MATALPVMDDHYPEFSRTPARASKKTSVLVATVDHRLRRMLAQLLEPLGINVLWASALEEVRAALNQGKIAACFCGSWLIDGTYRNVVHVIRKHSSEIPMVVVCEPECSREYRDYLAALNIRAFDFFSHPYERSDFARIMKSIVGPWAENAQDCVSGCDVDETVPAPRPVI